MKKLYTLLLFIVITLSSTYSQNFEGRIVLDGNGFIAVQFRNTTGVNLPNTSTLITDFEFDIRWLKAQENGKSADIKMMCHDGGYPFVFIEGPTWPQVSNLHQFRKVYISNSFYPPDNWVLNEWVTVFQIAVILDDNNSWHWLNGSLEIGETGWGLSNKCIDPIIDQSGSSENDIDVLGNGLSGIEIPTGVELIWVGGAVDGWYYDEHSWNFGENWEIVCPDGVESNVMWTAPRSVDDCTVPAGRTDYPKYPSSDWWEDESQCNNLLLDAGGEINWQSTSNSKNIYLNVYGDFDIQAENGQYGNVTIGSNANIDVGDSESETGDLSNDGYITLTHAEATLDVIKDLDVANSNGLVTLGEVTVIGDTDIQEELGLIIKADATGVGAFINEGDINFASKAGAKVETYISGSVGDYYMHFAGPTVLDSTNFYNGLNYSGVRLEQFNMTTLDTYAYEWNPLADTTDDQPWINVYPFWHNVLVAKGLAITNWEEGSGTMEMVGKLVTEEVSHTLQSAPNNNLELISNPFSSAINFADLYYYGNNSDVIKGHYWVYDASTGNYYGGALAADSSMIQVGQGFFVEVNGNGGDLVFSPEIRSHSDVSFRETVFDILKLKVSGGEAGYIDELTIRFDDNATVDYDENLEVKKWNSYSNDATMVRSIAEDGSELSVNAMPYESLYDAMTSIPIHFECGYGTQYTFNFSGMETFEYDISIWMEDLFTGDWMSISETNPMFSFDGSPNDNKERFRLHFLGPTSIEEMDVLKNNKPVHIYSSGNNIYIRNKSNQMIKEVTVYNILGQELYKDLVSVQEMHQISIKGNTGYYIVHVRTDQSFTTEKVFITRCAFR